MKQKHTPVWLLLGGFCLLSALTFALCLGFTSRLPENVGRDLTWEERERVVARNSPLTEYVLLSPNADFPRSEPISRITVHHMAADMSLEELGEAFGNWDRQASANYGIDSGGRVALYVEESNRAWTSAHSGNDNRAVTIEVANDQIGGQWHVSDEAFEALVQLCVDICRRNGMEELRYTGGEDGSLTTHKMFDGETICPGPYLEGKLPELARRVSEELGKSGTGGGER